MDTRPVKWQRIIRQHYVEQRELLSDNDKDSEVISYIVDYREHQAGLIVTVEYLDTGLNLDDDCDNSDTRQESYLIPWRTVAQIALQLQNKPPRKQRC